jgi:hypothetical protein
VSAVSHGLKVISDNLELVRNEAKVTIFKEGIVSMITIIELIQDTLLIVLECDNGFEIDFY